MPAEYGRRSAGASSGKASAGASSATEAVARATSCVTSWRTARPDSISTSVGVAGTLTESSIVAQPLERLAMVGRDPRDERGRRLRPVALRPAAVDPGGALGDQPLQGAVGVGPREPGRPGDGVAGAGAAGEEDLVDQALGGGEAEVGEIEPGHD